MSDYREKIHESCDKILNASYFLQKLSNAFVVTGNEKVGNDLLYLSAELSDCQRSIRDSIGQKIDADYKQSLQSTANMMNALLAGAKLERDG